MGNPKTTGPDYLDQKPKAKKKRKPTEMEKALAKEAKRHGGHYDLTKTPYPKTISSALFPKKKKKK